jgi:hypothetical protein
MTVSVRLQHPDDATLAQVRQTLGAFLFASDIAAVERQIPALRPILLPTD